jgi:hypothetical protein
VKHSEFVSQEQRKRTQHTQQWNTQTVCEHTLGAWAKNRIWQRIHPASYLSVYIVTLSLYVRSKEKELNTNINETLKLSVCLSDCGGQVCERAHGAWAKNRIWLSYCLSTLEHSEFVCQEHWKGMEHNQVWYTQNVCLWTVRIQSKDKESDLISH